MIVKRSRAISRLSRVSTITRQAPVTFAFRLKEASRVTIKIYDPAAREVDLITRDAVASDNAITWDPGARPSGLYLARVEAAGQVLTQPFAILR